MGKILVTGGCGYIGSHTMVDLIEKGFEVISVDNGMNSSFETMDQIGKIVGHKPTNYPIDLCDKKALDQIFKKENIVSVIHFAALKAVGESVQFPLLYYKNNVLGLINLLDVMQENSVEQLIFSSSCTVYGQAKDLPVTEETVEQRAESPYGYSKQICERIIQDVAKNGKIKAILLRYFNPAGAHESCEIGESPINPALNLVPIITEVAAGKRDQLKVFGSDYPTRDGSCIRDYIHVMDLADAHTKALQWMQQGTLEKGATEVFNLGSGNGASVLEAIHAFEKVSGLSLNYTISERRPGDVTAIYANYKKATEKLGWAPKRNISDIMKTAWAWEQKRSNF